MELGVDAVPGVVVDRDRGELDQEEDPLHGPAEDEVMNERAGGLGMREADGKPDAHAGDGAEDAGEDEEEFRVADQLLEPSGAEYGIGHAHGLALGHGQIEPPPTANCEIMTWKMAMMPITQPEPRCGMYQKG